jgi:hypothetical protein
MLRIGIIVFRVLIFVENAPKNYLRLLAKKTPQKGLICFGLNQSELSLFMVSGLSS